MKIQSFTSLFEIYTALSVVYSVIDEILTSKQAFLDYKLDEIMKSIEARKLSIYQSEAVSLKVSLRQDKKTKALAMLGSLESETQKTTKAIRENLQHSLLRSHVTHFFTCFFILYCLSMLFFSGLYDDATGSAIFQNSLDNSLFIFNLLFLAVVSVLYIDSNLKKPALSRLLEVKTNSYIIAVLSFFPLIILSVLSFYLFPDFINFQTGYTHNVLVLSSVFIPLLGPFLYIFKALNGSGRATQDSLLVVDELIESSKDKLAEVDDYLMHVKYLIE